ncbi:MAG TPA: hypothetical protein VKS60_03410 [Stellaceae bacterium]|nr:hypothetical protein [Stellaceae bacterium]
MALLAVSAPAAAGDVAAAAPQDLSVTIYRAPSRGSGSIELASLGGFALVTETRAVNLPAGTTRLVFEGVADGIEPASAIVTGLPSGVIEKNRDARLLSPTALVDAALGKKVTLVRTDRKTGKTTRTTGTIRADADGGVVFETAEGVEALRCSGLPETFIFNAVGNGVSARPTLSVLTKSDKPLTATVTLSYLARNFDWAADYVATLSPDGKTLDLGAWVTLANGNGTGFPSSRTQVVAGRLNRESGEVEPIDLGGPILATCWPRGTTSDIPMPAAGLAGALMLEKDEVPMETNAAVAPLAPPPKMERTEDLKVQQEQLGDLKLYRVPDRTTVASRQSKQVRLVDKQAVPVLRVYGADLPANQDSNYAPANVLLRSKNDAEHHLGLPLPSGRVAVFEQRRGIPLLVGEAGLKDTALDEEVEFKLGPSPDVQVRQIHVKRSIASDRATELPLVPGIVLRTAPQSDESRVEIDNAGGAAVAFELQLALEDGARVVRADQPLEMKNGRPLFRVTVPANGSAVVRYQVETRRG